MITKSEKRRLAKSGQWYLSWDTCQVTIECSDATKTDITKLHGCVEYRHNGPTIWLSLDDCQAYFGHCPKKEGLIYVWKQGSKWRKQTIDLAFSD